MWWASLGAWETHCFWCDHILSFAVLHFLFLHQLSTQNPTSHPILRQLSFFTNFNKLCKKLLKGFLKMQEDYYAHTTPFSAYLLPFLQMSVMLDFTGAFQNLHNRLCSSICPSISVPITDCIISPGMATSPITLPFPRPRWSSFWTYQ